jgi:hypothetical protein
MKLYEVMAAVQHVHALIEDGTLDENAARDTLEGMMPIVEERVLNMAAHVQNIDADVVALKAARERLAVRIKRAESSAAWFKGTLKTTMEAVEMKGAKCDDFEVKIQKNPVSVAIADVSTLHDDWMTTKTTKTPNKKALKIALTDGATIDGVTLKESNRVVFK